MNRLSIKQRFLLVSIMGLIVPAMVLAVGMWRESNWNENRFDSAEQAQRMDLAIHALRKAPANEWKPNYRNSPAVAKLVATDPTLSTKLHTALEFLDRKLAALAGERLHGRYYLDPDVLAHEIANAKGLYGSPAQIALMSVRSLKAGRTLEGFLWGEDLSEQQRGNSPYWSFYAAKRVDPLAQKNPWGPRSGAILVEADSEKGESGKGLYRVGGQEVGYPDGRRIASIKEDYPEFRIPALENVITRDLHGFLAYGGALVEKGNKVSLNGKSVPSGYDVILSLDPYLQDLALKLAGAELKQGYVSSVTLMAMDVNTGEIKAVAEAEEPQHLRGGGLPLIFQEVPAASTSKLIFGTAILENQGHFSENLRSALPNALKVSDTDFFERVAFDFGGARLFRDQAAKFGWNNDCLGGNTGVGGVMDYLFGTTDRSDLKYPLVGRIFVVPEGENAFRVMTDSELSNLPRYHTLLASIRGKANRAHTSLPATDVAKRVRVAVAGQGDVRTSAWGELLTISHIASAANGSATLIPPHLVRRIVNATGATVPFPHSTPVPVAMRAENARLLATYLHAVNSKGGTAEEEFRNVFGRYAGTSDRIFAKTGSTDDAHSTPYKLYVAAFSRGGAGYDSAVVVITERRLVDGRYHPSNFAANLALRFIKGATR